MLILKREKNEKIVIVDPESEENNIEITLLQIEENQVKIGIDAPKNVRVHREEIYRILKERGEENGKRDFE